MSSNQTDLLIQTVMNEATRLGDFLAGLDESAWSRDSACDVWVIGDVVAHLAGGAATWANSINQVMAGYSGPSEGQEFMSPGQRGSEGTAEAARSSQSTVRDAVDGELPHRIRRFGPGIIRAQYR